MGARKHWAALGLYSILTLGMTWPLASQFGSAIPGDGFDGWQNYWNLWWMRIALVERIQWPLFTDLLYFPTGVSLHFHTLNPFNGLLALPVQLASGLIPAYNFVVLVSFILSGYGAFLLALHVLRPRAHFPAGAALRLEPGARTGAALLAGLLFTFAPFHMAHLLGHMQVFAYQWVPFAVLYLLRALEGARDHRRWVRAALLGGLFLAFAGLCDWYFVLYLALFAGLAVLWFGISGWRESGYAALLRVTAAAALLGASAVLLLAPLLVPMVAEALRFNFMVRPASDLYILSASLLDFLVPNRLHVLFRPGSFLWPGNQIAPVSERTIAAGYFALLLALGGLLSGKARRRTVPWLLAAGFFVLLALGPQPTLGSITESSLPANPALLEYSPYALLNRMVPFMRISRSVSRFALMVQLCLSMAAALGAAALLSRVAERRARALRPALVLAVALVLAEFWVAPYPMSPPDTPAYYQTRAAQAADPARPAVLNLPMNYDRPGYLLYQTVHQRPLTVAYISRDDPRTLTERVPLLQHLRHLGPDIVDADPAEIGATVLADLGVGTVILDNYKMPGGLEREYTEQVAAELFAGQAPDFEDERITVFTPEKPDVLKAYLRLGPVGWGALERSGDGATAGRRIGAAPASIELMHGSPAQRLRIDFRSAAPVEVVDAGARVVATLPAAPEGGTALLEFGEDGTVRLRAPGGALVQRLALEAP